jgi:methionyl-tRNA formyltransferase
VKKYIIAASKKWFLEAPKTDDFSKIDFTLFTKQEELTIESISRIQPRYIFFPHWSWIVPAEIYQRYECVCFHTAPLPIGRGGSPVQNLIARNFESAPVCALKMTEVLDGGPIYHRIEISLLGGGDEIFLRIAKAVEHIIIGMVANEPMPVEQVGAPVYFKRRAPHESILPEGGTLRDVFNHIRMLDATDYPLGFIEYGNLRIEFKNAVLRNGSIEANVIIKEKLNPL